MTKRFGIWYYSPKSSIFEPSYITYHEKQKHL